MISDENICRFLYFMFFIFFLLVQLSYIFQLYIGLILKKEKKRDDLVISHVTRKRTIFKRFSFIRTLYLFELAKSEHSIMLAHVLSQITNIHPEFSLRYKQDRERDLLAPSLMLSAFPIGKFDSVQLGISDCPLVFLFTFLFSSYYSFYSLRLSYRSFFIEVWNRLR